MFGSRLRLGLMLPCVNSVIEPEFSRIAPSGVSAYATRMLMRGDTKIEQLSYMAENLPHNIEALMDVADIFVYCCTSGSFIKGAAFDQELTDKIKTISGKQAVTAAFSIVNAVRSFNVRKVVLATPYIEEVNRLQVKYFAEYGIETVAVKGLDITARGYAGTLYPHVAYELAKEVFADSGAEAVVISCTNFRTIDIIEMLEKELCVPVISSNQAVLWAAMRAGGVTDRIWGFGKLLEEK